MIPSSDCTLNPDIFEFMTQVRLLKKKKLPRNYMYSEDCTPEETNLLIRHARKKKAHVSHSPDERISLGAKEEFATIHIHPDYKKRINDLKKDGRFKVCIFDDYMIFTLNTFMSILRYFNFSTAFILEVLFLWRVVSYSQSFKNMLE